MYSKQQNSDGRWNYEIKPFIEKNVETKNFRQYVSSKLGENITNKDINNVKQTVKQKTKKQIKEDHKVKCLKMYWMNWHRNTV